MGGHWIYDTVRQSLRVLLLQAGIKESIRLVIDAVQQKGAPIYAFEVVSASYSERKPQE